MTTVTIYPGEQTGPLVLEVARVLNDVRAFGEDEKLVVFDNIAGAAAESRLALATEDGRGVGLAFWGPVPLTENRVYDLFWLAVRDDRAGRGIGTELIDVMMDDVRNRGGRIVRVESGGRHSERAAAFYARRGFETTGKIDGFYPLGGCMTTFVRRLEER